MIRGLREAEGAFGLVAANGGFLSKYSVGVYSTKPSDWRGFDSTALQAEVDGWAAPPLVDKPTAGTVETYTVDYSRETPSGVVVARDAAGARFLAMTDPADGTLAQAMIAEEPLGASIACRNEADGRRILTGFTPA